MIETKQHVCWNCIKGRHLICTGVISGADADPDERGKLCECPVCHANIDSDRKPVFDPLTGRYFDPGQGVRIVTTLRVFDTANVLIWQGESYSDDPASWIPDPSHPKDGMRRAIEWRHTGIAFPPGLIPFTISVQLTAIDR